MLAEERPSYLNREMCQLNISENKNNSLIKDKIFLWYQVINLPFIAVNLYILIQEPA